MDNSVQWKKVGDCAIERQETVKAYGSTVALKQIFDFAANTYISSGEVLGGGVVSLMKWGPLDEAEELKVREARMHMQMTF